MMVLVQGYWWLRFGCGLLFHIRGCTREERGSFRGGWCSDGLREIVVVAVVVMAA